MKLTKKGEYGLRSLINLGIAAEVGRPLVQAAELARGEKMPIKFLEAVLLNLRDAGFVESVRGKHGGYRLRKPANAIVIGQVVRLLDGPLAPIGCVSQTVSAKLNALNGQLGHVEATRRREVDGVMLQKIANDSRSEEEQRAEAELEARNDYLANQRISAYMKTLKVRQTHAPTD